MDYILAKKLKDAGFSKYWGGAGGRFTKSDYCIVDECDFCSPPSLSELIEACGNGFDYLFRKNNDGSLWIATTNGGDEYEGETPEIAVAHLWLELNKK